MLVLKYILIIFLIGIFSYLGNWYSRKYINREKELEKLKSVFNILETKIQFTYKPLPDIFMEIAKSDVNNITEIFRNASNDMKENSLQEAWENAVKNSKTNLNREDIEILLDVGKILGSTDIERTNKSNWIDERVDRQ